MHPSHCPRQAMSCMAKFLVSPMPFFQRLSSPPSRLWLCTLRKNFPSLPLPAPPVASHSLGQPFTCRSSLSPPFLPPLQRTMQNDRLSSISLTAPCLAPSRTTTCPPFP
eukprot:287478-Chlamydomonas_euryale.AAC.1